MGERRLGRRHDAALAPAQAGSAPPASSGPTPANPDGNDPFLAGRAPTPDLLEGVWRLDNDVVLVSFTKDGDVRLDNGGRLFGDAGMIGTYEIAGDLITVRVAGGPAGCAGQNFAMRASLPAPGALHFVHTRPGKGSCTPMQDEKWVLHHVLPTNNKNLAGLDFSGDDFQPVAARSQLHGDWMAQGGGFVLELTPFGEFYVADSSGDVVDHGRWNLVASRSQLHLLSAGDSPTCDEGASLVLRKLRYVDAHPTAAFHGTMEENTCGGAWASKSWILLPNDGS